MTEFEVIGEIAGIDVIARGPGIRDLPRLNRQYGKGKWRKLKGYALVRLRNGRKRMAENEWLSFIGTRRMVLVDER
ncbi:hypothetical protein U5801_10950 [Lamprobacter modestohalophilus]|uniref:hypothetical protein n=1 Tax=Lamprobacter modestohalophilus TaxID=1064514 RepID=UPI002ADEAD78|nr:hypothetical protein [Lamprobacter modestohalophilus]MEA1050320.1 hypothetical protein [Lamprobacter modestohalophilus]